nr:hypothetical protein [Pedobacter panaciterrae]
MKLFCLIIAFYFTGINTVISQTVNSEVKDSLVTLRYLYNREYSDIYKENADLSYISPRGELTGPVKYIINGRVTKTYMILAIPESPIAFAIVPDFTVKVIDERSSGVRTPSLKLGGTLYFRLSKSVNNYKYATLKFTHHSNGQDGEALNSDGTINTINGNFSTNYLTIGYNSGTKTRSLNDISYSLNHYGGFEWHKWFNYEKALKNDYGFTRVLYDFSLRRYVKQKENWRADVGVNYAVNAMQEYGAFALKKRLNVESSFNYSFPFMNNVFLMAAVGYYGEDPYNIYYQNKYSYIRLGVSSGL